MTHYRVLRTPTGVIVVPLGIVRTFFRTHRTCLADIGRIYLIFVIWAAISAIVGWFAIGPMWEGLR